MITTTVSTADPETGADVEVPDALRDGIDRAATILESELGELTSKFPISADWHVVRGNDGGCIGVELDLTTTDAGVKGYPIPADDLRDDESIRRKLRKPIWHFGQTLSNLLRLDLERIRHDLETLATVTGE